MATFSADVLSFSDFENKKLQTNTRQDALWRAEF